jgi:hypothetical protein
MAWGTRKNAGTHPSRPDPQACLSTRGVRAPTAVPSTPRTTGVTDLYLRNGRDALPERMTRRSRWSRRRRPRGAGLRGDDGLARLEHVTDSFQRSCEGIAMKRGRRARVIRSAWLRTRIGLPVIAITVSWMRWLSSKYSSRRPSRYIWTISSCVARSLASSASLARAATVSAASLSRDAITANRCSMSAAVGSATWDPRLGSRSTSLQRLADRGPRQAEGVAEVTLVDPGPRRKLPGDDHLADLVADVEVQRLAPQTLSPRPPMAMLLDPQVRIQSCLRPNAGMRRRHSAP